MRPALLLALPLLGAACVPTSVPGEAGSAGATPGEVRITDVNASPSRLVVRLSNGARCVSERPEGEPGGWSGVTSDCGYQLPYTVTFQQGGAPERFIIEDPSGIPAGANGGLGARAEVFIVDVSGQRRLFVSALGPNVRFGTPGS